MRIAVLAVSPSSPPPSAAQAPFPAPRRGSTPRPRRPRAPSSPWNGPPIPPKGARAEASARFIRVATSSSTDEALRAIGASLDLPARGTCAAITALAGRAPRAGPVVELLDVGGVTLQADGGETRLAARQLPDVTDVVTGVVYARATDPSLLPAAARYVIHVAGGRERSRPLRSSPRWHRMIRTTCTLPGKTCPGLLVATGATVELSWQLPRRPTRATTSSTSTCDRTACAACSTGARRTEPCRRSSSTTPGRSSLHRLRREPFSARGIDSGEVRFDFARTSPTSAAEPRRTTGDRCAQPADAYARPSSRLRPGPRVARRPG